jgi:hypothetical protein
MPHQSAMPGLTQMAPLIERRKGVRPNAWGIPRRGAGGGTKSARRQLSCGANGGHRHEDPISRCDRNRRFSRRYWARGPFRPKSDSRLPTIPVSLPDIRYRQRLGNTHAATSRAGHAIGSPVSGVRGFVFGSVQWLTAGNTKPSPAGFPESGRRIRAASVRHGAV